MHIRAAAAMTVLLAMGGVLAGCEDDFDGDEFEALLDGANEVPPVNTVASGVFTATDLGNRFSYRITVEDLDEPTFAHIHAGAAGVNGGIVVFLFTATTPEPDFSGRLVDGTFDESDILPLAGATEPMSLDSLRVLMRNGNAYVNVHTTEFPGGEIRGQVVER